MGYFSDLAIELEEEYNIDLDDYDFDIEQYLKDSDGNKMDFTISQMSDYLDFKRTVEKEIENDHSDIPDDFRYFFYRLLPDIPSRKVMRYHMYVSTPQGNSVDLTFTDRYDYVRALYAMSKNDNYNVFFSLIPYRKKRKTKANATHAQGFFIDIDGLDFDVLSMTKEEVIDFLMTEYGVPSHLLPQMICKSGHGLHLFMWLWEPIKDENIRRKIAESLVTYYKADFCSSRITQNIRVPGSFNVKASPLKTEYYMINDHGGFFIDEFKHFMKSKEEIEDYKISENKKRAAKSAATRAKNEAERIARGEPPKQRKKKNQQPTEQKEEKKERPKPVDISNLIIFVFSHLTHVAITCLEIYIITL